MNFLCLPHMDVIENHVLKYMETNRILGFRRVCKATKIIADNYLRNVNTHKRVFPEIAIHANGDEGKSFGAFLHLGFSVSKIILKVERPELLGSDEAQLFLQRHGRYVTKLKIDNFHCLVTPEEYNFFNALPNLAALEIGNLHNCQVEGTGRIPRVLQNLKEALKIDYVINSTEQPTATDYVSSLFKFAIRSASYIKLPIHRNHNGEIIFLNYHLVENIAQLIQIQQFGSLMGYGDISYCEYLDLGQYKFELLDGPKIELTDFMQFITTFQEFCQTACGGHIKLINVDAKLIQHLPLLNENADERDYRWLLPHVLSIRNVANSVIFYDQTRDHIEEINIESTTACSVRALPVNEEERMVHWINLEKLSLCVDSSHTETEYIQDLYRTLFVGGQEYAQLTHLSLAFTEMDQVEEDEDDILPNVHTIVECCAHVKRLKIQNWPGTNESLSEFWKLEKLEQVCIQACEKFGDDAFIGQDANQPTFLKLQKLWKLELKSLDLMPNITDSLFSQVIGRMKLTRFVITADSPLQSVTVDGIQALLAGEFAKSIEKFAFSRWSLNSLVEGDTTMEELGRQFKCNCML